MENKTYAGFWIRLAAYFIDNLILTVCIFTIMIPALLFSFIFPEDVGFTIFMLILAPCSVLLTFLYFTLFESSVLQATPGKLVVGIQVENARGERLSFGRAAGRFGGRMLCEMTNSIGYILVAFTTKKQGLHDLVVDTYVVHKHPESAPTVPLLKKTEQEKGN